LTPPADSLGQVSIELARLLDPLRTELTPENARNFFAQIGITVTDTQATALAGPLATVVGHTEDLIALVPEIIAALVAEDFATAIDKGLQATVKVGQAISALDALANAAQGLSIPDAGTIGQRIFDFLLARYLDNARGLNDALEFFGLLERDDVDADPPFTIHTFHFGAIGEWLSDPAAKAESLYGWGSGFDGQLLFPRLERLVALNGLPVLYDDTVSPRTLDAVFVEIVPASTGTPGFIIRLKDDIALGQQTIPIGRDATLELDAQFDTPLDTEIAVRTDGSITFTPPTASSFSGSLDLKVILRREEPPDPFIIFGQAGGNRLEFRDFTIALATSLQASGGSSSGDLDVSGALSGGKVVIDATEGDGFLGKILPGTHVEADFSVFMGISTERGFYFGGSSALEVRLPVHIELGPIAIEAITLGVALDGAHVPMSVGADIRALLGPITAVVQNMGVTATLSFPPNNTGNLGPAQIDIGFKPPNGVGLRVVAGPITGGGFLSIDNEKGEYIGALELSFEGVFSLKAIGIINTKMPDGSKGFALLILITAEFAPIQLGYGFTLLGVGGLLGLNRSLDSEALRLGVRTGAVSSVLFPPDVIGNIIQIVSDLKAFFPIVQGHFIVAPMGKLGWGTPTLISLELGIILDIPSPQLTIIGVLRCILPEETVPVLKLQVNFAGGVDFQRGLIWFDASLFDSSLLVFVLTGDMALRIGWGDQPLFVLTVGGFHPAFDEVPSDLTGMRRIGIALLSGNNPRLFAQTYFAVTSNTVQSGARVELYAAACGFNIYGFLGYDLLIHFDPFHFVADIEAGLALRRGDDVIAGIDVSCELSGPTPWHARGSASFKILFFRIRIRFDETWGDDAPALPAGTAEVLTLVAAAVDDVRNWRADPPVNTSQTVSLRQLQPSSGSVLLHPFGVLAVSQKVAPLELTIDKFGNKKPIGETTFTITRVGGEPTEPERDEFAVANFVSMSDSEKLSRKSFEKLKSGLRLSAGDGAATGNTVPKDVTYEMSYLNRKQPRPAGKVVLLKSLFDIFSRGSAAARTPLSVGTRKRGGNGPAAMQVSTNEWQVVNVSDLTAAGTGATASTQAEAFALRDAMVRANPVLSGAIQVMASHELFSEAAA
jgi:hypothetical protein